MSGNAGRLVNNIPGLAEPIIDGIIVYGQMEVYGSINQADLPVFPRGMVRRLSGPAMGPLIHFLEHCPGWNPADFAPVREVMFIMCREHIDIHIM